MGKVTIQTQRQRMECDTGQLIKQLSKTLVSLDILVEHNDGMTKANGPGPLWFADFEHSYYSANIYTVNLGNHNGNVLYQNLYVLRDDTRAVIAALEQGATINKKIWFALEVTSNSAAHFRLALCHTVEASACPTCKELYTKSGLTSHIGSLRCMRDAQLLDVKALEYELIDDSSAIAAIRKAGIEFKIRPSGLDMYVPKWVSKAVKDYKKNTSYAGLKLHEFLAAVKGE